MSELTEKDVQEKLVDRTIVNVAATMTESDSIHSLVITLSDGTSVHISPTSYNYGGQHLELDIE